MPTVVCVWWLPNTDATAVLVVIAALPLGPFLSGGGTNDMTMGKRRSYFCGLPQGFLHLHKDDDDCRVDALGSVFFC